jgi:hypothetical protein
LESIRQCCEQQEQQHQQCSRQPNRVFGGDSSEREIASNGGRKRAGVPEGDSADDTAAALPTVVVKRLETIESGTEQATRLSSKIIKNKFIKAALHELAEHMNHRCANTVDIKSKVVT